MSHGLPSPPRFSQYRRLPRPVSPPRGGLAVLFAQPSGLDLAFQPGREARTRHRRGLLPTFLHDNKRLTSLRVFFTANIRTAVTDRY